MTNSHSRGAGRSEFLEREGKPVIVGPFPVEDHGIQQKRLVATGLQQFSFPHEHIARIGRDLQVVVHEPKPIEAGSDGAFGPLVESAGTAGVFGQRYDMNLDTSARKPGRLDVAH